MARVWLITGCSSGFGQEIALAALEHGDKVVATARDPSKLQVLVSNGAFPAKLDVTSSDEIMAATVQDILKEVGQYRHLGQQCRLRFTRSGRGSQVSKGKATAEAAAGE